jgi:hypothetical protein
MLWGLLTSINRRPGEDLGYLAALFAFDVIWEHYRSSVFKGAGIVRAARQHRRKNLYASGRNGG